MMKTENNVHLYIIDYNRRTKELLLDFIVESEFEPYEGASASQGRNEYEPTMILVQKFAPHHRLRRDSMIILDREEFNKIVEEGGIRAGGQDAEWPSTVFVIIEDGSKLADLIDDPAARTILYKIPEEYGLRFDLNRGMPPLPILPDTFTIKVWNVGEGNTNSIVIENTIGKPWILLFDFGASTASSTTEVYQILSEHNKIFDDGNIILIISHWHLDHFKLLCHVSDDILSNVDCLVCPWPVVGLSAKKAVKRIHSKTMVYGIKPGQRLDARCGIMKISDGGGYSLFTGEEHLNPNLSGLLLSVSSKRATAFLTADHSNHQIWDEMYAELKDEWKELNIVVPHHGGNGGKSSGPKGKNPGQAVISVGNNHYGHPKKAVIKSYESAGFKVSRTDIKKDDIDIIM